MTQEGPRKPRLRHEIVVVDRSRIADPEAEKYGESPYPAHPNSRAEAAKSLSHQCAQAARAQAVAHKFRLDTLLLIFEIAEEGRKAASGDAQDVVMEDKRATHGGATGDPRLGRP